MTPTTVPLSRKIAIQPGQAALLVIDVQNWSADPASDALKALDETERSYFLGQLNATTLPNLARLLTVCRTGGIEVVYRRVTREQRLRL